LGEVFTGKLVKGEIVPMNKEGVGGKSSRSLRAWPASTMPKKNCHGVRKARAEGAIAQQSRQGDRKHKPQAQGYHGERDKQVEAGDNQPWPGIVCSQQKQRI
jgi:hypothetical protein